MPDLPLPQLPGPASPGTAHIPYEAKEKCGVFGVWSAPGPVAKAYYGLYAQQHRGQEAAGIAASDGRSILAVTGTGLVPEVFDADTLGKLERHAACAPSPHACGAIGHTRYSTAGGTAACNAQPLLEQYVGGQVAVAHNGNLVNADALRRLFEEAGHLFHTTSDTEVVIHLLASPDQQRAVDPLAETLRHLQGAFCLLFLFPDRIEAARDPWGWRPLVIGRLPDGGHVVASETVALDVVGAQLIREVEPGEIVTLSAAGLSSRRFALKADPLAMCVFEHVYFASPASSVFGQNVQLARESMGERLAAESPVNADVVMPMPDSGRSAAIGFARASGIPLREGIVPNRYVGRTFIKPTQAERAAAVRLKLNVIAEVVGGKRIVVVDDSIVRGTTTRAKVEQIRAAGAKEIHLRISCPPIRHPCYFGVDFATRDQLIAHDRSVDDIRAFLGVDSLAYLSLEGLLSCVRHAPADYCSACFSGDYRIDIDHPTTGEVVGSQLRMNWPAPPSPPAPVASRP
ncbi:MAG: amidophosphoribosyltransferase [Phycisphaerae bacterium]|nr:amidophosphoribosyltransferase [Phycisphaerae bacterium]